jgi:hypothetical protein
MKKRPEEADHLAIAGSIVPRLGCQPDFSINITLQVGLMAPKSSECDESRDTKPFSFALTRNLKEDVQQQNPYPSQQHALCIFISRQSCISTFFCESKANSTHHKQHA